MKKTRIVKDIVLLILIAFMFIGSTTISVDMSPALDNEFETSYSDVLSKLEKQLLSARSEAFKAYQTNEDIIGYVYMENYISEPVASNNGKGFDYYERRDLYHNYDIFGTVFLSDISENDFSGNSLIYGHNSNIDRMFYRLQNLKNSDNAKKAPPLILYDLHNDSFKIMNLFAGFTFNTAEFHVHQWTKSNKDVNDESFNEGILYERATIKPRDKSEIDFTADAVILQTCTYIDTSLPWRDIYAFYEDIDARITLNDIKETLASYNVDLNEIEAHPIKK